MAKERSLKKGAPALRSMATESGANGIIGARKVGDPWQKKGSMDEILKYEPVGIDINPKKTAIIGSRARGL